MKERIKVLRKQALEEDERDTILALDRTIVFLYLMPNLPELHIFSEPGVVWLEWDKGSITITQFIADFSQGDVRFTVDRIDEFIERVTKEGIKLD